MILIDANVLIYAAGSAHPYKAPSTRLLERVARGDLAAIVNAETLQEILHRYRSIKRWKDGRRVYDLTRELFPDVIPIGGAVLDRAREIMDEYPKLMVRDALHAAVVMQEKLDALCSYDRDFDAIAGFKRIEP